MPERSGPTARGLVDAATPLRERGYALLEPGQFAALAGATVAGLDPWRRSWDDLPADTYLRDGGRYRRRRHASFVVRGGVIEAVPQRAHWQPLEYNALHGGLERWFEPIGATVAADPAWPGMLRGLATLAAMLRGSGDAPWFVEAHQFRIDTTDGIGRPTPEGAHRDGVDLVAVILVARNGIKGGETRVFDAAGPNGVRFTMSEPWSCLLLDDARVVHESTPIQPLDSGGHRDTLVITLRRHRFQGPGAADPSESPAEAGG